MRTGNFDLERDTDWELLDRYLSKPMEKYFTRKLPDLEIDEVRRRIAECLKGLIVLHLIGGNIPFSDDIDAIWHYWILQTAEYAELCRKLPGGEFLHHSSADYPRAGEPQTEEHVMQVVTRLTAFFAIYVSKFGPINQQQLTYWPTLQRLLEALGWNLDRANRLFAARARDFEAAYQQFDELILIKLIEKKD